MVLTLKTDLHLHLSGLRLKGRHLHLEQEQDLQLTRIEVLNTNRSMILFIMTTIVSITIAFINAQEEELRSGT